MMQKIMNKIKTMGLSFWLIVVLPTFLSIVYFGLIASDRYISTSSFVVRSPQKSSSGLGLSAILQNVGFSGSTEDSYVVNDYVLSRDAMLALDQSLNLREKFSGTHGADLFSRFNPLGLDKSNEALYEYYKNKVEIILDSSSSITTLDVRAYSAEDARQMNEKLLAQAEALVNQLNTRGRQDMLNVAEENVRQAEARVKQVATQLTQYRANNQIFDIEKQSQIQMQLISKLQDQLILVKTQLSQLRVVTPDNPQIKVMIQREKTIEAEIAKNMGKALGGNGSLNQKAMEFEKLTLEKEFATKQLAVALATLEQNKNELSKKQLYLERISQPNAPDDAVEPKKLRGIITTLLLGLIFWGILSMLTASVREHND